MNKQEIENRIAKIDELIVQQSQTMNQINNNILMMHGAKQELDVWLKKALEQEKVDEPNNDSKEKPDCE
ncbi:MAG TPA: hypothetical protein VJ279_08405 [Hanamia sp.]|jgi:hypothetical protein|nr:hypothetical protein [Hanamia sp.]